VPRAICTVAVHNLTHAHDGVAVQMGSFKAFTSWVTALCWGSPPERMPLSPDDCLLLAAGASDGTVSLLASAGGAKSVCLPAADARLPAMVPLCTLCSADMRPVASLHLALGDAGLSVCPRNTVFLHLPHLIGTACAPATGPVPLSVGLSVCRRNIVFLHWPHLEGTA
jgi:hypothetical protein